MSFRPGDRCGDLIIQRRLGKGGMAELEARAWQTVEDAVRWRR